MDVHKVYLFVFVYLFVCCCLFVCLFIFLVCLILVHVFVYYLCHYSQPCNSPFLRVVNERVAAGPSPSMLVLTTDTVYMVCSIRSSIR